MFHDGTICYSSSLSPNFPFVIWRRGGRRKCLNGNIRHDSEWQPFGTKGDSEKRVVKRILNERKCSSSSRTFQTHIFHFLSSSLSLPPSSSFSALPVNPFSKMNRREDRQGIDEVRRKGKKRNDSESRSAKYGSGTSSHPHLFLSLSPLFITRSSHRNNQEEGEEDEVSN